MTTRCDWVAKGGYLASCPVSSCLFSSIINIKNPGTILVNGSWGMGYTDCNSISCFPELGKIKLCW